jgi:hypothetical protein
MENRQHASPKLSIRAWINPDSGPDVIYVVEAGKENETSKSNPA